MALADGVYVIRAGNARMVGADGVYSPLKTMPACGVPSRVSALPVCFVGVS